jgi:hypothetical protein
MLGAALGSENLQTMRAFGAELEILLSEQQKITAALIDAMKARATG